jgi:hypothetical protein
MIPPDGMMATPNQSEIRARVLRVDQDSHFMDKWYLDMEILESRALQGGDFARIGAPSRGFTFGATTPVKPGDVIRAKAEFLGDARGGQFRLTDIEVIRSE